MWMNIHNAARFAPQANLNRKDAKSAKSSFMKNFCVLGIFAVQIDLADNAIVSG
jgi:hypothetical protein